MTPLMRSRRPLPRGFSLIELMVGLALAMLATVAALYAYKSTVGNALSTQANSRAQNISASIAVQLSRLLPQAAWGIGAGATPPGGSANTDVVLLTGAEFNGSRLSGAAAVISGAARVGNAVVWDTAISGTTQCHVLALPGSGGLLLAGPVACASAAAWKSLSWPSPSVLLPADALAEASFTVVKAACWPYASIQGGQGAVQVTLNGSGSAAASACLTNIPN